MAFLTGGIVKRLMRAHKKTISGLARSMGVTQKRVREVRSKGEGSPVKARDWIEAITGKDPGALKNQIRARKNALRFRDLAIGAWFEFYGWGISFRGPYQKKSQTSFVDTKGKRKRVGSIDGLVERAAAPNPKRRRARARSNPRGVVIGDSALELRYEGGQGKRKGSMRGPWKHPFESDDVQVIGKKGGSIELRSKSGKKLWDYFEV